MEKIVASIKNLTSTSPNKVGEISSKLDELNTHLASMSGDVSVKDKLLVFRSAAANVASNCNRIVNIIDSLNKVHDAIQNPKFASVKPKFTNVASKIAGLFAEVDTVEDLDGKSLEAIEKAVHSLYGDQSKNSTMYLDRRGKGHQSK